MSDLYTVDRDSRGVVTISLNRPEIHNAFNDELINQLTAFFNNENSNTETRVLVLTGVGKSFCAGADLNWMKSMKDYSMDENIADSKRLDGLFKAINHSEFPVIARVNGAALGGGVGLVSVCDYVISQTRSKFGLTEVVLGLLPAVISPYVIRKIGESNARATFLSGRRFDAHYAKEIGLVHEVVELDELDKATETAIENHLKAGPNAAKIAKVLIKEVLTKLDDASDYTCSLIAKQRVSEEGQEGMTALLEKRKPYWIKES